jgi:ABC-type uncharacterized transport system involved in gliding motility auxiliary subunit
MKNAFRKFLDWITGPKSDFILFAILLVLLNIVGTRAFVRIDLTPNHSYSLSRASREVMRTIEEPLSVKVFFTKSLPAPYNSVESYLRDLLVEYRGAANKNFSCEFFDMTKKENQELAQSYGIGMSRIQELKDNEVGIKNAYMGLVLAYADGVEVVDNLSTTEGLEYKLTTTIGRMISTANVLSGLSGKVTMTLYSSPELANLGVRGVKELSTTVASIGTKLNKKYRDRIEFASVTPASAAEIDSIVAKYGLHKISWSNKKDGAETGTAVLGVVLSYGDRFRAIPLDLARDLFGGYGIGGLDTLETTLADNVQGLMSQSPVVGYVTGHGEKNIQDEQRGAARLAAITSDVYEMKELDLATESIPAGMGEIIVNGPRSSFSDAELYKLDQFLLRGGNLFLLMDPFDEQQPQGQMAMYGGQPTYTPINTGLERLLAKYGVSFEQGYVLDKTCYVARQQGQDDLPIYYVARLGRESLNAKNPVSRNLAEVFFLQSGGITFDAKNLPKGRTIVPLADSSAEAWLMKDNISLVPYAMQPPVDGLAKHHLAVLAEGSFESAFDATPAATPAAGAKTAAASPTTSADSSFSSDAHLAKSVQPGKLIVIATSAVTSQQVMDAEGREPISIFVRNCVDYLGGKEDLIDMRTKGLSLNTLSKSTPVARAVARSLNMYGLPALVVLAGLFAWRMRVRRRREIEAKYLPGGPVSGEGKK